MVVAIGEILVDVFQDERQTLVLPGGAPFNVACNIAHFGGDISFVGAVGNDDYGRQLIAFAQKKKFSRLVIKTIESCATTQAFVALKNGERSFTFKRDNGADYHLSIDDSSAISFDSNTIVHLGSLLLTTSEGREFVQQLLSIIDKAGAKLSFDLNFRADIFGPMAEVKSLYQPLIERADMIKFSEEELLLYTGKDDIRSGLESFGIRQQLMIVTLGHKGSIYYLSGHTHAIPSIDVTPVDTTGAGDAFYSYILYSLDQVDYLRLSDKKLEQIFYHANIVGALATLKKGAIDVVPTHEQILGYLNDE